MNDEQAAEGYREEVAELVGRLRKSDLDLRSDATLRLERLASDIRRWNSSMNLVSRKDVGRLVSYHFGDSASVLPLVRPDRPTEVLDIGGSNGLPGLVLSALSPHIRLKICDSRHKRSAFLQDACDHLGTGATFEIGSVDSEIFRGRYQKSFDLIVARAVTKLKRLLGWCLPLLKPAGKVAAYKGSRCFDEVDQAVELLFRSGGAMIMVLSSPWAQDCNPLRLFAIAGLSADPEVGMWAG